MDTRRPGDEQRTFNGTYLPWPQPEYAIQLATFYIGWPLAKLVVTDDEIMVSARGILRRCVPTFLCELSDLEVCRQRLFFETGFLMSHKHDSGSAVMFSTLAQNDFLAQELVRRGVRVT